MIYLTIYGLEIIDFVLLKYKLFKKFLTILLLICYEVFFIIISLLCAFRSS